MKRNMKKRQYQFAYFIIFSIQKAEYVQYINIMVKITLLFDIVLEMRIRFFYDKISVLSTICDNCLEIDYDVERWQESYQTFISNST